MSDKEAQDDELLALASIYEGNVFSSENENGKCCGQFRAFLSLPKPFHVLSKSRKDEDVTEKHLIEYLPAITLHFQLPSNYPSSEPPQLSLSCKWLNREQMTRLCQKLDEVWKDNAQEVVLYHWISFLSAESLTFLNIENSLDLSVICPPKMKSKSSVTETNGNGPPQDDSAARNDTKKKRQTHHFPDRFGSGKNSKRNDDKLEASSCRKTRQRYKYDRGGPAASHDPKRDDLIGGDCRAIQEIRSHDQLLRVLLDFDQLRRQQEFDAQFFTCKVCFEEKLGSQCLPFKPCNHVFCKECLKSYFSIQIQSGNVQNLSCPEEKCPSHALPTQVRELVNPELYAKYDRLLLTSTLDTMADIIYCPRINCQCPVLFETGSNMASCPSCFHVFCVFCKMAYHGIVPCRLRPEERLKIVDEYLHANSMDKQAMEQRYGRQQLRQLIDNTLSEEWVRGNSKSCPRCRANIEKLDGCNKMTCWKCDTYFCWLCMTCLSKGNPYKHFNDTESSCQGRLFQGVDFDDDDSDNDFDDELGRFLD